MSRDNAGVDAPRRARYQGVADVERGGTPHISHSQSVELAGGLR